MNQLETFNFIQIYNVIHIVAIPIFINLNTHVVHCDLTTFLNNYDQEGT